jgi:hypothetical protein
MSHIPNVIDNSRDPKKMAKDEEYEAAVAKGNILLQMMLADDRNAGQLLNTPQASAQSTFTSVEDLATKEYTVSQWTYDYENIMSRLQPALQYLEVDDKMTSQAGKNIMITHKHAVSRLVAEAFNNPIA